MATGFKFQTNIISTHWLRSRVQDLFRELHQVLEERERALLLELESYNSTIDEYIPAHVNQDLKQINGSFNLSNGINHPTIDLSKPSPSGFEWDKNIFEEIRTVGQFVWPPTNPFLSPTHDPFPENSIPQMPKKLPISRSGQETCRAMGKGGIAPGEFNVPRGIAIDPQTSSIYVADCVNNRVQVFNSEGEYKFHFGKESGEGKMSNPWGVCVAGVSVYVTQLKAGALHAYKLDGTFMKKCGNIGNGQGEFQHPEGITSDVDGNLIVCDRSNNRIQVLDSELRFLMEFGNKVLYKPRDVKIVSGYVIVLDKSSLCLHVFAIREDKSGVDHVQDLITQGMGKQVCKPTFFTLDDTNCILISDQWNHAIKCFSSVGESTKEISSSFELYRPQGIAFDPVKRQTVCICWNRINALHLISS